MAKLKLAWTIKLLVHSAHP